MSKAGFGTTGADADGRVPKTASYETGHFEVYPPNSVTAHGFLSGFDQAEAHLARQGRLVETSARSTASLSNSTAVREAELLLAQLETSETRAYMKASKKVDAARLSAQKGRDVVRLHWLTCIPPDYAYPCRPHPRFSLSSPTRHPTFPRPPSRPARFSWATHPTASPSSRAPVPLRRRAKPLAVSSCACPSGTGASWSRRGQVATGIESTKVLAQGVVWSA